jgi:CHAT domain-containing protein
MIAKPTLIVHTTYFSAAPLAGETDEERAAAEELGKELYGLLTRAASDPLAWGPGIPVRIATSPEHIDVDEAEHVVVLAVLGAESSGDEDARRRACQAFQRWAREGARALPVLTDKNWRASEHELNAPILRELYTAQDPRRATINEILLFLARTLGGAADGAAQLFISHAKVDLARTDKAAEKLHQYVVTETTGKAFFDKVSVLPGEELAEQLEREATQGVFVIVRGDLYSSRAWCRQELLLAKQQRLPIVTVELLSSGESRSAAYSGNGVTITWDRAAPDAAAAQVLTLAMVERVRHLFFQAEARRVIEAAGLPNDTECLSRPPEVLDVVALRRRPESTIVLLHPDPPLPVFERTVLEDCDKRVRTATPTTAFANVVGSAIRAPLDGWQVALSLSEPHAGPEASDAEGLTPNHLLDATTFLARALIGAGGTIAYGGDFREKSFTTLLAQLVVAYRETGRTRADFLHGYIAAQLSPKGATAAFTSHWMRKDERALLRAAEAADLAPSRAALYFSDMRRVMAEATRARILLGGPRRPRADQTEGYSGRFPGVVEEAWRTLQAQKPLYVAAGFGGAAELVRQALEHETPPAELTDAQWAGNANWAELVAAWQKDPDVATLALPPSLEAMARAIYDLGHGFLASDAASVNWNGLTVAENRLLFATRDPLTLTSLVLKGLVHMSTRAARGQLRVELVEGDVTRATGLDVLVFPTFTDVVPTGAGRALDRVTGGAAMTAFKSRKPVPVSSPALGSRFVLAADLGTATSALSDSVGATRRASEQVATTIRLQGFKRVGVVTFLGNVADNLEQVIRGMVSGLIRAADTAEVAWYESDPERAEQIAQVLQQLGEVSLTRRTEPKLDVAPEPERKRTTVQVRQEAHGLSTVLLLHRANGLAPMLSVPFDDAARLELTGAGAKSSPAAAQLDKIGSRITDLLFGAQASQVLENVQDTELILVHDARAGGIPFEAMSWGANGARFAPATGSGIVRRLLVDGVRPERALTRPRRARRVGVLVVVNPTSDLPGAEAEGEALLARLRGGPFDVRVLRGAEATLDAVMTACGDPEIDVLHYCGHGFFNGPGVDESGLNLAGDERLTLTRLTQLKSVPRLAFVNACQAGRVRGSAPIVHEPQAFAEFFLRAGVDAYLGTFWLVSDEGAAQFASQVYEALVDGRDLGQAVIAGRKALADASNSDWANYLLYGDASFRLVEPSASRAGAVAAPARSAPSVSVAGNEVVARWSFATASAPTAFSCAVVESDGALPIELAAPQKIERADAMVAGTPTTTWTVTLELAQAPDRELELRPSAGEPLTLAATRAPDAAAAQRAAPDPLSSLRVLLDQQPNRGLELLAAMYPSADPAWLREAIDVELDPTRARAIWPFQGLHAPPVDGAALAAFVASYRLEDISVAEAARVVFQTREDWKAYAVAPGAIGFTLGKAVNAPVWPTLASPAADMTHDVRPGEFSDKGIQLALFADNANGLHASRAIAKQIVEAQLPYAFHLGDVYYGGSAQEFRDYFEAPLAPMFDRTELFMISGNHEMFARGEEFQNLIRNKAEKFPSRQRQRAEMFRLRGAGFQVLGIDTMFSGWTAKQLRVHDRASQQVLEVLETWLAERPDDLTILMTPNEPWDLGSKKVTPLYQSLVKTIAGRVDLWFWGNVHYAALYEPWRFDDAGSPARNVIASCIGHGGYPFYTQQQVGALPDGVACRWLEKKSRFWPDARIRPDVGANGWCRLGLARGQQRWNVNLTYVDWAGRDSMRAVLSREDGGTIRLDETLEANLSAVGAEPTWTPVR